MPALKLLSFCRSLNCGISHCMHKATSHWAPFTHALITTCKSLALKLISFCKSLKAPPAGPFHARAYNKIEADRVGHESRLRHLTQRVQSNLPLGPFLACAYAGIEEIMWARVSTAASTSASSSDLPLGPFLARTYNNIEADKLGKSIYCGISLSMFKATSHWAPFYTR
jgi:hypothetical protein